MPDEFKQILLTPLKHPLLTKAVLFFGSVAMILFLTNIGLDNSLDIWFDKNDETTKNYEDFKTLFGNDATAIVIYKSDSIFSDRQLGLNRELTDSILAIPEVKDVLSLSNIKIPRVTLLLKPFYFPLIPKNADPERAKRRATGWKILKDNVISSSGFATAMVIAPDSTDATTRSKLISHLTELLSKANFSGNEYYLVGNLILKEEMYRLSNFEPIKFLLICLGIIFILLYWNFKSLQISFFALATAVLSVIWAEGFFGLFGQSINMITGIIPLIIIVVGLAGSIHIITSFQEHILKGKNNREAIRQTLLDVSVPCLFSALTTAFAFLAFSFSKVGPISSFGLFTAIGVLISFFINFSCLPLLLLSAREEKIKAGSTDVLRPWNKIFGKLSAFIGANPGKIMLAGLVLFVLSLIGISKITLETNQIEYLKKSNSARIATDSAQQWFEGIYPIEIVFNINDSTSTNFNLYFNQLTRIEKEIHQIDEVKTIHSPLVLLEDIIENNDLRVTPNHLARKILHSKSKLSREEFYSKYVSEDGNRYRMSVKARWLNNEETVGLVKSIRQIIEENIAGTKTSYYFTGVSSLYVKMNDLLTRNQLQSTLISFVVIFVMLIVLYRQFAFALIGMTPNILPIVTTLGIMGWMDIPLDVATVLLTAISLGIAVDDTIHYLNAFKINYSRNSNTLEAIDLSYKLVGRPITITTILLICGFSVMAFSNFLPVLYLGVFVSLNVFFALIYDLFLLPALLLIKN